MSSYPKLGLFRLIKRTSCKKHGLSPLEFDILLYAAENDLTSQRDILTKVSNSMHSMQEALRGLKKKNLIREVRKANVKQGIPKGMALTGRGRMIVTEFYMDMFPNYV